MDTLGFSYIFPAENLFSAEFPTYIGSYFPRKKSHQEAIHLTFAEGHS
jgi:hypothetical protein